VTQLKIKLIHELLLLNMFQISPKPFSIFTV